MILWATFMLEFWKRAEHELSYKWGTHDLDEHPEVLPAFDGVWDDVLETEVMDEERERKQQWTIIINFTAVTLFTLFAGATMLFFSWLRFQWTAAGLDGFAALLNAGVIVTFNTGFKYIAEFLTGLENWRTEESFNSSFVVKLFIFQFVNSYFTLYIVNFIKPFATRPHIDGIASTSLTGYNATSGGSMAGNWVADVVGMCGCQAYVPTGCFQVVENSSSSILGILSTSIDLYGNNH